MFILDSLMISGIKWALQTTLTAAETEMNDDAALRDQLLEAEMRRETGEISDEEYRASEADLLARIREIRERREGTAPLELGAQPMQTSPDTTFTVEAELSGNFHEPVDRPRRPARAAHKAGRMRAARIERPAAAPAGARTRRPGGTTRSTRARRTPRTIKA